ncbi:MAG: hypothetical protein ACJ72A_22310, partial [Nocardioidaceae bacterium]
RQRRAGGPEEVPERLRDRARPGRRHAHLLSRSAGARCGIAGSRSRANPGAAGGLSYRIVPPAGGKVTWQQPLSD